MNFYILNFTSKLYFILLITVFSFHSVYADTLSFSFENDAFVNDDSGYTSGVKLAWLGEDIETDSSSQWYGSFMKSAVESIPFLSLDENKKHNAGMAVNQMMFTPEDLSVKRPQYNDIPYSGTLLLSFFLFEWDDNSYHEFYIDTGVVGPNAYGKQTQKFMHKIIGARNPQGWDNQLDNQIMFDIAYGYGNRTWEKEFDNNFKMDWLNTIRGQVGNFYTGASINTMFRIGENYPKNFNMNVPGNLSHSQLLSTPRTNNSLGWALSAGAQGDGVSYLYVIDSAKNYDLDRNKFSGSLIGALSLYYKDIEVDISVRRRTSLIKHSSANTSSFGSFSILWHF